MATVAEIYAFLNQKAPFSTQMSYDNAGFLVGRGECIVEKILVALDITQEVIAEAVWVGANLIVSHHPVIWEAPKSVTGETVLGRKLLALMENKIAAICAHTNLDMAIGGVNDVLVARLGLEPCELLAGEGVREDGTPYGVGVVCALPENATSTVVDFAEQVKARLGSNGIRYMDGGSPVRRVAVGGGACGNMIQDAILKGCDTFVTSDLKYNQFLEAKELGLTLIDAGHFPTEDPVCAALLAWLSAAFPHTAVEKSTCHREAFHYLSAD